MASYRFFPGKTKSWLEAKLDDVNEQLAAGKMVTGVNSSDTGGNFQREANLRAVQQQIIWDLWKSDPDGGWDLHLLPSVTRGVFVDSCGITWT